MYTVISHFTQKNKTNNLCCDL